MTRHRKSVSRALIAALLLVAGLAHAERRQDAKQRQNAKRQSIAVRLPKPGSADAARGIRQYVATKGGILVPNRMVLLTDAKTRKDERNWAVMRHMVKRHLKQNGVKLAPLSYQRLVKKVRQRAEKVLNQNGGTLGGWKSFAVEGGKANVVNAAAWTGGVITVNRPLIDLAFQIGRIVDGTGSKQKIDKGLWHLANYRRGRGPAPEALKKPLSPGARKIAEGIVGGVVMHEMGHAANGHLEMKQPGLWLPGQSKGKNYAASRHREWQADDFMAQLGARGGSSSPSAIPYFSYYMHIANPRLGAKSKLQLANTSTHPLNFKRYNASRKTLRKLLPKNRAVNELPKLGGKLWLPPQLSKSSTAR